MIPKRKKIAKRMLEALDTLREEELSHNKGRLIRNRRKPTSKVRRHSGRKTAAIINPRMKWAEVREQIESASLEYYDDWSNYRDGMRRKDLIDRKKKETIERRKAIKFKKKQNVI